MQHLNPKLVAVLAALLFAVHLRAADKPAAVVPGDDADWKGQPGVVLDADGLVMLRPGFPSRPHILLVNTAGAVDEPTLFSLLRVLRKETQAVVWTNAIPRSMLMQAMAEPGAIQTRFSTNAILAVLIERAPDATPLLVSPGRWARLNLTGIDADKPAPGVLEKRLSRAVLRAAAYATGAGAVANPLCVMWQGIRGWRDLDTAGRNFSPESQSVVTGFLIGHEAIAGVVPLWKLGEKASAVTNAPAGAAGGDLTTKGTKGAKGEKAVEVGGERTLNAERLTPNAEVERLTTKGEAGAAR